MLMCGIRKKPWARCVGLGRRARSLVCLARWAGPSVEVPCHDAGYLQSLRSLPAVVEDGLIIVAVAGRKSRAQRGQVVEHITGTSRYARELEQGPCSGRPADS